MWTERLAARAELKCSSLCLQLTNQATSTTAQTKEQQDRPLLVHLGQREVEMAASDDLGVVLPSLYKDLTLKHTVVVLRLLATICDIIARFSEYGAWK